MLKGSVGYGFSVVIDRMWICSCVKMMWSCSHFIDRIDLRSAVADRSHGHSYSIEKTATTRVGGSSAVRCVYATFLEYL